MEYMAKLRHELSDALSVYRDKRAKIREKQRNLKLEEDQAFTDFLRSCDEAYKEAGLCDMISDKIRNYNDIWSD